MGSDCLAGPASAAVRCSDSAAAASAEALQVPPLVPAAPGFAALAPAAAGLQVLLAAGFLPAEQGLAVEQSPDPAARQQSELHFRVSYSEQRKILRHRHIPPSAVPVPPASQVQSEVPVVLSAGWRSSGSRN